MSIPAKIAEGFNRRGEADKLAFFNIAQGSIEEVSKLLEAYSRPILDSGFWLLTP